MMEPNIKMNYINSQSFRCLLGKQSKDVEIKDNLFTWTVNNKKHFAVEGLLTEDNIFNLKKYGKSNFHYLSEENLTILKSNFDISKSKGTSILLNIEDLSFSGKKYKNIRHAINRASTYGLTIENNFRNIKDVETLIHTWRHNYSDKYFRDNSGKNLYFYSNNFHANLNSIFLYKDDKLLAFGTLSDNSNGYASYILGKALYKECYGLSEFADVELYKIGQSHGIKYVNMGGGTTKALFDYKKKFNYSTMIHYDGNIE